MYRPVLASCLYPGIQIGLKKKKKDKHTIPSGRSMLSVLIQLGANPIGVNTVSTWPPCPMDPHVFRKQTTMNKKIAIPNVAMGKPFVVKLCQCHHFQRTQQLNDDRLKKELGSCYSCRLAIVYKCRMSQVP